jgi:hypothetical protein
MQLMNDKRFFGYSKGKEKKLINLFCKFILINKDDDEANE